MAVFARNEQGQHHVGEHIAVEQDFVVLKHDADVLAQKAQMVVGQIAQHMLIESYHAF